MAKRSNGKRLVPVLMMAAILIAAGYLIWSGGYLARATDTSVKLAADAKGCEGTISILIEVTDAQGQRVPDALVDISLDSEYLDSLYSDRNGRVREEVSIKDSWCGRSIAATASFRGDGMHLPSQGGASALVKAPTMITLILPNVTVQDAAFNASVRLTDAMSGEGLAGRTVSLDGRSSATDAEGNAYFLLSLNESAGFTAAFEGDGRYEASESSEERISVRPLACDDGTLPGECSGQYICRDLALEFDCGTCGCPSGLLCIDNGCISEEQRVQRLIVQLQESDVLVENDIGTGSGIIIKDRWVLTARHVVDPDFSGTAAANIEIFNSEREIAKPQRILLAPNDIDLAVIVINKDMGPAAEMGSDESIERGAGVLAIGSPLGIQDSVTKGIVSNLYEAETASGFEYEAIQIDAPVNPGNSGGGLFLSRNGKLIGVTTSKRVISKVELAEGLGFAVPIGLIEEFPVDGWEEIPVG